MGQSRSGQQRIHPGQRLTRTIHHYGLYHTSLSRLVFPSYPAITHMALLKTTLEWMSRPAKEALAFASVQWTPSVENHASFKKLPLASPPITHMALLKTKLVSPARPEKAALAVASFQFTPSVEDHTSFKYVLPLYPPITHMALL